MDKSGSGKLGEEQALAFLLEKGYRVIERNYRTRYGELDLVCREAGAVAIVEVRSRNTPGFASPAESVTPAKQKKIIRAALAFLSERGLLEEKIRFDVVCVDNTGPKAEITLIKDAFEPAGR